MIRPLRARFAAPFALLAPLSLAACAAAPPPLTPAEPPPPGAFAAQPREVSPVDQEMLAIGHAEEEIDRIFPAAGRGKKGGPPPPPPIVAGAGKDDAAKSAAEKPSVDKPALPLGTTEEAGGGGCGVACRALSSMLASADRLCKLAGENDGRCDDARARARGAMTRVKTACPGCAAAPAPDLPRSPTRAPQPPAGPAPGMPGSSTSPIP